MSGVENARIGSKYILKHARDDGAEHDEKYNGEDEGHEREKHFNRRFIGKFFGAHKPPGPDFSGLNPQNRADAYAHFVRLDQSVGER